MFRGRHRHVMMFFLLLAACVLGGPPQTAARDLTDVLERGFSFNAGGLDTTAAAKAVAPAFSAAVAQAVTQEFPLASVSPAFTYRYNPTLSAFERSTGVPGPLFSERALTLGAGQLNFGIGYSFIDFSDLNGTDLDNIRSPALLNEIFYQDPNTIPLGQLPTGEPVFLAPASATRIRTRIDLNAHVVVPTVRYGLTDRWDVSLSIPILNTFLRVRNEDVPVADLDFARAGFAFARLNASTIANLGFADRNGNQLTSSSQLPFVKSRRSVSSLARSAGSATGVGDISLRTKYHLWRTEVGGAAVGLNLQLPSGEVRDLHGSDETHLSTFVYLSQVIGERVEPHVNLGVDFNGDDVDRSSFLYAVGGTLLVGTKLGLSVDFLGRSEFGRLALRVPANGIYAGRLLNRPVETCTTAQPCFLDFSGPAVSFPFFPVKIRRNDIADFSFGLRYALGTSGSVFFGGIIPLNDDGLRADFIPSGGIEYTF